MSKDYSVKSIIRKTREDYNRIARHFSDTRYGNRDEFAIFQKYVHPGQTILDWGCGNGRLVLFLKDKQVRYIGLDQSTEILKIARKKWAKEIKEGWVKFYSTAKRDKIFPANYLDGAFLVASFHHLPDEQSRLKLLRQIWRALKPGGYLIMNNWNLESDWAREKIAKHCWKIIGRHDFLIPWKNPQGEVQCERYYHHFSLQELRDLLERSDYEVKRIGYFGQTKWTSDQAGGRNLSAIAIKKAP